MSAQPNSRPMLSQSQSMPSYGFVHQGLPPKETQQKNYVFVDEHNRHKRLKVMRACEGCRRRKIKCDSATTNSWPCAACTRLKLTCIPPTVNYDDNSSTPGELSFEFDQQNDYPTIPVGNIGDYQRQPQSAASHQYLPTEAVIPTQAQVPYTESMQMYQQAAYLPSTASMQGHLPMSAMNMNDIQAQTLPKFEDVYQSSIPGRPPSSNEGAWNREMSPTTLADDLSEAMGDLKIDITGSGAYLSDKIMPTNGPAVGEVEVPLPPETKPGTRIQIPHEMMPTNELALRYFDFFFDNIHPYVPVLNRASIYQQWATDRDSMSPLLLESLFACSALIISDEKEGQKWLALASRHEESFKDVPRLSTVQAKLLLIKAREAAPTRNYFYRSWTALVDAVMMAKDLEINHHYETHQSGHSCGHSAEDCVCMTRCWQLLYVLEGMIGGPQGRFDLNVMLETVPFEHPTASPGLDEEELRLSIQQTYMTRVVRDIRGTMGAYAKLRKREKNWETHPDFTNHDRSFPRWLAELPAELQIELPADGSMPWIPSSFIANMHCYHYLAVVMHHRPQIRFSEPDVDPEIQTRHLLICHDAAKKMCRIQEAILHKYGLAGLLYMQRGISFTVYCVLSCTMLHLVSITSPNPALNSEARGFFVRHMRILEKITPSWPIRELQTQVLTLRQAFSADINKPFELRPGFPFGSPSMHHDSPTPDYLHQSHGQHIGTTPTISLDPASNSAGQPLSSATIAFPITPPFSAVSDDSQADSPAVQSMGMMNNTGAGIASRYGMMADHSIHHSQPTQQWNPSRLYEQWNAAFGTPIAAMPQSSPSSSHQQTPSPRQDPLYISPVSATTTPNPLDSHLHVTHPSLSQHITQQPTSYPVSAVASSNYNAHASAQLATSHALATSAAAGTSNYQALPNDYITPSMWQDAVASTFGDGLKRRWEYQAAGVDGKRLR